VDEDVSIQEQDVKKVHIKQIKDEVIGYAIVEPEKMEEGRLVYSKTSNGLALD
jgi:hypothetical protein